MAMTIGPLTGPGPLWPTFHVGVLAGGDWLPFDVHAVNLDDAGLLVLRKGEELPESREVMLTTSAAFPMGGWHGLKLEGGKADDRATSQYGFKPPGTSQ